MQFRCDYISRSDIHCTNAPNWYIDRSSYSKIPYYFLCNQHYNRRSTNKNGLQRIDLETYEKIQALYDISMIADSCYRRKWNKIDEEVKDEKEGISLSKHAMAERYRHYLSYE